MLRYKHYTAI